MGRVNGCVTVGCDGPRWMHRRAADIEMLTGIDLDRDGDVGVLDSRDAGVVLFAMEASRLLSRAAGAALNPFLKLLMMQLYKHAFSRVEGVAEAITETLQCLEEQGGDDALAQIKRKIPTYCSIRI